MAIFPEVPYEVRDPEDRARLEVMEDSYTRVISINETMWGMADRDSRAEAGDPNLWSELYNNVPASRRNLLSLNHIRTTVNMIHGHQCKNRKSIIAIPVENADQETADQFSKILMWLDRGSGILETFSDSFHDSVVGGISLIQVTMDYRADPVSGDVVVENCPYNTFIIDPFFKKKDLSDCNFIWKRTYITRSEALSYLPDKKDIIMSLSTSNSKDGKFNYLPETFDAANNNLMSYDEYYYRSFRSQKLLVDKQTGESMEWDKNDPEGLEKFLKMYPQVSVVEQDIPTVRLTIVLQGKIMYDGPNPLGIDSYPFVPVLCYFNPQITDYTWRIQGVVRGLIDAQFLYNRRKAIELDMLESQVTSGWIYKEGALVNPMDVFKTGQGKSLVVKSSAQMTDLQQIQPGSIPPSTLEVSRAMGDEINSISGVSEELLGSAVDDKAGVLAMLRQSAGLTTLQPIFSNADYALKLLGSKLLGVIQNNFMPGKVKRILNEEPLPQFYNKAFGKYDCAVEEGLNTTTQKQMQFAQYIKLREIGVPIPDESLIEAVTLQNKSDLIKTVQQQQQQEQQMQQQQAQVQMAEIQARTDLAHARATADKGLGLERVSRIEENKELAEERKAEAYKDRAAGLLDLLKGMQEIDNVDIDQLQKLVALSKLLQAQSEANEDGPSDVAKATVASKI